MSMIKSYQNDAIAVGAGWEIAIEEDKTWRNEVRRLERSEGRALFGIQIKNGSNEVIKVRVDSSDMAELIIAKKQSEAMVVESVRGILITNAGSAEIPANSMVITVTSGASKVSGAAGLGDIYITEDFGGEAKQLTATAAADTAFRVTSVATKMRDVLIYVSTNDALVGDADGQVQPLGVGESIGLSRVDVSTLYFKNANAGQNTVIILTGVLI